MPILLWMASNFCNVTWIASILWYINRFTQPISKRYSIHGLGVAHVVYFGLQLVHRRRIKYSDHSWMMNMWFMFLFVLDVLSDCVEGLQILEWSKQIRGKKTRVRWDRFDDTLFKQLSFCLLFLCEHSLGVFFSSSFSTSGWDSTHTQFINIDRFRSIQHRVVQFSIDTCTIR